MEEELVETGNTVIEDKEYVLTFGIGQVYQNKYWRLTADNYEEARKEVIRAFKMNWSQLYLPPNALEKSMVLEFPWISELK